MAPAIVLGFSISSDVYTVGAMLLLFTALLECNCKGVVEQLDKCAAIPFRHFTVSAWLSDWWCDAGWMVVVKHVLGVHCYAFSLSVTLQYND